MKFLSNIDLQKNQLLNAVIQVLPSAPTNGVKEGQIYFDSVSKSLKVYNGTAFDTVGKEYEGTIALAAGLTLTVNNNMTIGALTDAHVLFANGENTIGSEAQLAISRGGTSFGTYAKGDILYSDATNSLDKLGIGATGTVLRVSSAGIPEWATGGSVDNAFVIKFDGATTVEGTNIYTFDGSAAKTIDFIGGNLITIDKAAGAVTFKHDELGAAYTTAANVSETLTGIELLSGLTVDGSGHVSAGTFRKLVAGSDLTITPANDGNITIAHETFETTTPTGTPEAPAFGGTFDVVDSITTDNGHVTAIQTTTITMPTETVLTDVDNGTGTWLTDIAVNDHEITLSRSNTTDATIQVGELVISTTGDKTGNLTVGGNAVITGNLTVNGTTTTLDTEQVLIKDNIILINSNQTGVPAPSVVSGIEVERGSEPNFQFVFVEEKDDFRLGKVGGTLQPVLTRDELANLAEGDILVFDATNKRALGKTLDELLVPSKFVGAITGDNTATSFVVLNSTHLIGNKHMTIAVYEASSGEQVFVKTTVNQSTFAVTFSFAVAPAVGKVYEFVLIG